MRRIKKVYETHKSKLQMTQACQFKLEMSKSSHDLTVTNLNNKISCVTQNSILSEMWRLTYSEGAIPTFGS